MQPQFQIIWKSSCQRSCGLGGIHFRHEKKKALTKNSSRELDRKRKQSSRDQFCKLPVAQLDDSDEPAEDEKTHHLHIDS